MNLNKEVRIKDKVKHGKITKKSGNWKQDEYQKKNSRGNTKVR